MVVVMAKEGTPDLEHVKKWATRGCLVNEEAKYVDVPGRSCAS
jgi:hypothetical protein